jgi:putative transposase
VPIFASEGDYVLFKRFLATACQRHGCAIHAYVLMTNHVHLLITPEAEQSIAKAMQSIGRRYVRHFNVTYGRTGTLWDGRYKATLIDTDRYLLTCYRYIEQNPVRSGQVNDPAEYRWSSYRANAFGEHDYLVTPHERFLSLGAVAEVRHTAYRALFAMSLGAPTLSDIREATQRGWPLGNDRFRAAITELTKRRAYPRLHGGDRRSPDWRVIKGV